MHSTDDERIRKSTIGCVALAIFAMALLISAPARAWSNGGFSSDSGNPDYGTHDWIADEALELQNRDAGFLKKTYHSEYLLATEEPDNPEYIGDTSNHHVYYYANDSLQDDASARRAQVMYDTALDLLRAEDFADAARYIGIMTHYVSDVGVFGHTMANGTDWGRETHHSDYEDEFESMQPVLDLPGDISIAPTSAYNATLRLAKEITFGVDVIMSNVWMDTHYNWSDHATFEVSAMHSLYESVAAVASAIDNLLSEAGMVSVRSDPDSFSSIMIAVIVAVPSAVGVWLAVRIRRKS